MRRIVGAVLAVFLVSLPASALAGHSGGRSHSSGSRGGGSHGGRSHNSGSRGSGSHHGGSHGGGSHGWHHHHSHSSGAWIFFGAPFWGSLGWWYPGYAPGDSCPECGPGGEQEQPYEPDDLAEQTQFRGATLNFSVEPDDAVVYVDEHLFGTADEVGDTLRGVPVASGKHAVAILRPGFRSWSSEVELAPGESKNIDVSLEK